MLTSEMADTAQTFANVGPDADTQEVQADVAAYHTRLSRKLPSLRAGESMCATHSTPCVALPARPPAKKISKEQ